MSHVQTHRMIKSTNESDFHFVEATVFHLLIENQLNISEADIVMCAQLILKKCFAEKESPYYY